LNSRSVTARGQLQAPGMPREKNFLPSKAEDLKSSRRGKGAGGSSPLARWSSSRATRPGLRQVSEVGVAGLSARHLTPGATRHALNVASIQVSRRKATRFAIGRTTLSGGALRFGVIPSLTER